MLTKYLEAAMKEARYEVVEDDQSFYGFIPGLQGVWANAPTLEACREELRDVLEDWLLLSLSKHMPIPPIQGIELRIREVA
jgi:predicted RNase H-like HicB family nuclease